MPPVKFVSCKKPISMPNESIALKVLSNLPDWPLGILYVATKRVLLLSVCDGTSGAATIATLHVRTIKVRSHPLVAASTSTRCVVRPAPPSSQLGEVWMQTGVPTTGWGGLTGFRVWTHMCIHFSNPRMARALSSTCVHGNM